MPRFLATFHSRSSSGGAIGIIDSDHGLSYLQVDNLPNWVSSFQLRDMAFFEEKLYITTPACILVYTLHMDPGRPIFRLYKSITLHEWMIGRNNLQADLLGVLFSLKRKQLLVANNLFNAVDEFTLDGVFTRRHFLHKIAPQQFPLPETIDKSFRYGHIRSIVETPDGEVLLTVGEMNGLEKGCILNLDSGIVMDNLQTPHGAFFKNNHLYIQSAMRGTLSAYPVTGENKIAEIPVWESKPEITIPGFTESIQNMRGIVLVGDTIFCGICHFSKAQGNQISPRIVAFDINTGKQQNTEIFLPDLEYFREPRVFFLAPLPPVLDKLQLNDFTFFLNGEQREALLYSPPEPEPENDAAPAESEGKAEENADVSLDPTPPEKAESGDSSDDEEKHSDMLVPKVEAVVLENVSLSYRRNAGSLFSFNRNARESREYQALSDISFTLYEGETLGIIGRNGSGKSTISMVISGALPPDGGKVTSHGRIQLLSIGLGFRNELTGRENVLINGALLGLSKKKIASHLPDIEEFAELDEFIDEPVRTYSAGMRSRLGFAVATAVSPDILILDEVMSTGDAAFRKKANERMEAMRERTKTIIIISHSAAQVKKMCSRVIWLNKGRVLMDGEPGPVLSEYDAFCKNPQEWLQKLSD